jgi:hypothetical protein
MVIDYSERRQQRKTPPPKRPSVWPSLLLIAFLMLLTFAAGLGTGWYLYRPGGRLYKAPATPPPAAEVKKGSTLPPQGHPVVPAPAVQAPVNGPPAGDKGGSAPPLTFYNTLQKGNKGLMGTGINQPKEKQPAEPLSPAATQPAER